MTFVKVGKNEGSMSQHAPVFLATEAGEVLTGENGDLLMVEYANNYSREGKTKSTFSKI